MKPIQVLLIYLAGLCAAAQFGKIALPFSYFQSHYSEVGTEIGWLLSLISLVGAIFGVVAGGLVNRFGAKNLLLCGLIGGSAISMIQGYLPSFTVMLVTRVIEGASHLMIVVAAPTLISQICTNRRRGPAMVLWSTFFGISFALIALFGLPLIETRGLTALLFSHGVITIAVAALAVPLLPNIEASQPTAISRSMFSTHIEAYSSPSIVAPAAGWLLYTLTFVSLLTVLPQQFDPNYAAIGAFLMPLVSIAASLGFVSILASITSSISTVIIGFALSATIMALYPIIESTLILSVTLFAALGLVQGGSFAAVPELNANTRDQALSYGLMAQMGNTGNLLGTPILLSLVASFGDAGIYIPVVMLYIGGIAIHLALAKARNNRA